MRPPSDPDDPLGSDDPTERLDRLAEAMDVYLDFVAGEREGGAEGLLTRHEALRDLLEPMLDTAAPARDAEAAGSSGPTPQPGQTLGDYRIVREVGRGGMGIVFEAEQVSLHRRVALKLLHEHLTGSPKAVERFRREAAAAARLRHPGIVPIHEVGEWRGRHYFTMEFLTGQPLQLAMTQPRLGIRADCRRSAEAAELVARVADALQHAHEHGLVHRDVKPHNIMVGEDGSVRLLDFGLVKSSETGFDSVSGGFLGTPHYCSPEQATGRPTGPASDVFSLGVVLYELLAGRRPFVGDTAREVLHRIETGAFEPLARAAPNAPRDLRTICEKAIEPEPAARYGSAGAMADDLRRFLRIEPILATPPGSIGRAWKWVRRHRVGVGLWTVTGLLLVGVPSAWAANEHRTRVAVERERENLREAERLAFLGIVQSLNMLSESLAREPGPGSRKQPRVDDVVALCERYLGMRARDPERTLEVAHAFRAVAEIDLQLANFDGALRANQRAAELLSSSGTSESAETERLRGQLLRQDMRIRLVQNPESGDEEFERALAHWRAQVQVADAATDAVVEYCATLVGRARALSDFARRRAESERMLRESLGLLTAARRTEHRRAESVAIQATCALGEVLLESGRTKEALAAFTEVVGRTGEKAAGPVLGIERALAQAGAGEAKRRLGDGKAAAIELQQAIDTGVAFRREYPGVRALNRALQHARIRLSTLLLGRRDFAGAEHLLREASADVVRADEGSEVGWQVGWQDRALRADIDVQLAATLLARTNGESCEEAGELLRGACVALEQLAHEQPSQVEFRHELGATWNNLAALANRNGEHAEARRCAERAIAAQAIAVEGLPDPARARLYLGMHYSQLAFALANLGHADGAVEAAGHVATHAARHAATVRLTAEAVAVAAGASGSDEHARFAVELLEALAQIDPGQAKGSIASDRFASLRARDDFAALRSRLEAR